ncbi:glutathione hydrolase 5 proenzyme-like [Leucoraja erinacea]|uniref:glutathione hydrolase 5 proenzyme-like n=1 Tax=Leucoraja erinaceus TaxID=7782 RepID=UPI0024556B38|nr:glutathione hydrolase 5 proenzyme-like [Leucoraja erinacea]
MKRWKGCHWLLLVSVLGVLAVVGVLVYVTRRGCCPSQAPYAHAAVAADSTNCSKVGRDILQQGGSAVDAAIAAMLCSSLVHPQSVGIGGGSIYTIYQAATDRVTVINAREVAAKNLHPGMFSRCSKTVPIPGAQWIGVPGEIQGYWDAHQQFGKLPWKSLFQPAIQLARNGIEINPILKKFLEHILLKPELLKRKIGSLFYNDNGTLRKTVLYAQLAKTLETIAKQGPGAFYNGNIAQDLIKDIMNASDHQDSASNLTLEDFRQYKAVVMEPLTVSLGKYTMYTPPAPSRSAIIIFMLKILEGFNFTPKSLEKDQKVETYHRIIESLKFANGGEDKISSAKILPQLLEQFAQAARKKIDGQAHPQEYYSNISGGKESYGTSHVSVIDSEGNAVSVTSSINHPFGSMVYSESTGIILNNQLTDFCGSGNLEVAGLQPPSSMSPSILLSKDRESMMVLGASGGSMITSAIAQVITNKLWFGLNMKEAITQPRIYVAAGNVVHFEGSFDVDTKNALLQKNHSSKKPLPLPSVVQGIFREHGCIEAVSDERKKGTSAGY